jgi:hypothetical protein
MNKVININLMRKLPTKVDGPSQDCRENPAVA